MGMGLSLAGCQGFTLPFGQMKPSPADSVSSSPIAQEPMAQESVQLVDRDVEAPEIYHVKERALWDGRPSLGGVWVAAPNVKDPERVIIRNPKNGKFVIGALFRREQLNPGPRLQLSADAATAIGVLAGQPVEVNVTALRRQNTVAPKTDAKNPRLASNEAIKPKAKPVASIAAVASEAIDKAAKPAAGMAPKAAPMQPAPMTAAQAAPKPVVSNPVVSKPIATAAAKPVAQATGRVYIQIGIFSIEANAIRAHKEMVGHGLQSEILREQSHGKIFWRVVVGPETDAANRGKVLENVKKMGFADAYVVAK